MTSINNYGYDDGLLSNSMVQLAQFCTEQFMLRYVEKLKGLDGDERVEATTMGSLVHQSLEQGVDDCYERFYGLCEHMIGSDKVPRLRSLINQTMVAIDSVQANGKQYGRVYTAPRMTSYWKSNFSHIEDGWESFAATLEGCGYDWAGYPPIDFFTDAYACVTAEKYKPVVPSEEGVQREIEVQGDFCGVAMVGSIDVYRDGHIIDYKTGRKEWSESDVLNSDQFNLYTYLVRQNGWASDVQVTVRDLRRNTSTIVHMPDNQDKWALRYAEKVAFADLLRKGVVPRGTRIPYGSGFHPGCPCPTGCSWV